MGKAYTSTDRKRDEQGDLHMKEGHGGQVQIRKKRAGSAQQGMLMKKC